MPFYRFRRNYNEIICTQINLDVHLYGGSGRTVMNYTKVCDMTEGRMRLIKWIGTFLLLLGVTLNTLNTPQWQEIVYPYNLYVSLLGSLSLLIVARCQRDIPYQILNLTVMIMYLIGIWNAWCPLHETHIFVELDIWPFISNHTNIHPAH